MCAESLIHKITSNRAHHRPSHLPLTMHISKRQLFAVLLTALPAVECFIHHQKLNTKNVANSNNHNNNRHHLQMRLNPTSFQGTSYTITEFPRPSLRRVPNKPITKFADTDPDFVSKTQDMLSIMYEAKG